MQQLISIICTYTICYSSLAAAALAVQSKRSSEKKAWEGSDGGDAVVCNTIAMPCHVMYGTCNKVASLT